MEEPIKGVFTSTMSRRMRAGHDSAASLSGPDLPAGAKGACDRLFTAEADLRNASGVYQMRGDKWLRIVAVNGAPRSPAAWTALIHLGRSQGSFVPEGEEPPPTGPVARVIGGTVTYLDEQGAVHTVEMVPSA